MKGHTFDYTTGAGLRWGFVHDSGRKPGGQRRQVKRRGFATEREALRELRASIKSHEDGTLVDLDTSTVLGYLQNDWLPRKAPRPGGGRRSRGTVGVSTHEQYATYVRAYIGPTLGSMKLQEVTADDVEWAYDQLETSGGRGGAPLSMKTLANVHGLLHKAFDDAVKRKKVARNVVDLVDAPRPGKYEARAWTVEELRRFLDHVADDRLYALWLLYATTGLRRGEALGLTWADLDLDAGMATVSWTLGVVGAKPRWKPAPKSEAGERRLALDPATTAALRVHRTAQLEERLACGAGWQESPADDVGMRRSDVVFRWPDGRLINPGRVSKWFRDHCAAAGLPPVRLHDVRHSYATAALRTSTSWAEVKTLSRRLGHASIGMTLDTYAHALPADDRDQADTLARLILGAP